MALLTRADVAGILGIADPTTIPQEAVDWATSQVEEALGKSYTAVEDATEEFIIPYEDKTNILSLSMTNLSEVSKIEFKENPSDSAWVEITETDTYRVFLDSGDVIFDHLLYAFYTYKVTYSKEADTPTSLENRLLFLYVVDFIQKFCGSILEDSSIASEVKSETIGDYKVEFNVSSSTKDGLSKVEQDIRNLLRQLGGKTGDNFTDTVIL